MILKYYQFSWRRFLFWILFQTDVDVTWKVTKDWRILTTKIFIDNSDDDYDANTYYHWLFNITMMTTITLAMVTLMGIKVLREERADDQCETTSDINALKNKVELCDDRDDHDEDDVA